MQEYLYFKNNVEPFKKPEPIKKQDSLTSKTSSDDKPKLIKKVSDGIMFQYGNQMAAAIEYIRK